MSKPVVGFIAGSDRTAGAVVWVTPGPSSVDRPGTAEEKMKAFEDNGIAVAKRPKDIVGLIQDALA